MTSKQRAIRRVLRASKRLREADAALAVTIGPEYRELYTARDVAGLYQLANELPPVARIARRIYECAMRLDSENETGE